MSLNTLLQKIQQKGKVQPVSSASSRPNGKTTTTPPTSARTASQTAANRPVDPVVARLKAARKAEREKKEQELREKKGLLKKESRPRAKTPTKTGPKPAAKPGAKASNQLAKGKSGLLSGKSRFGGAGGADVGRLPRSEKKPKMSFSELMKKASLIDQSKMSIEIKQKTKSPDAPGTRKPVRKEVGAAVRGDSHGYSLKSQGGREQANNRAHSSTANKLQHDRTHVPAKSHAEVRAPLPARKPSEQLQKRLQLRPGARSGAEQNESEDDWSSFIASDEEEQASCGADYDRDEIWSMFNKGRKRSYYERYDDEDSDDMEATGAEILEEELRSKRRAMEEDKRELAEEQRLAMLKQARKQNRK